MKRMSWPVVWLMQFLAMVAGGFLTALAHIPGGVVTALASWIFMPLLGGFSACLATLRGLLNYIAWMAPPICMALTHYLLWRYMPDAGPVLLCALISIIGAATGEVLKERKK